MDYGVFAILIVSLPPTHLPRGVCNEYSVHSIGRLAAV